ncbi:transcriptional regulator [Archaeoglobus neptunius]|uniref:transcriptional regulator n=1 Tax=Archaeoglobus neptunius TaxID=2798580 RepID=UPI001E4B4967|nr:transcriptional regulator [Archaeoglobus neptunius]
MGKGDMGMNPLHEISDVIENMKFKPSDIRIYSLLLEKGEMRVSEIARELGLSVRFVRDRLKVLVKRGIVKKELIERGWVGYIYKAEKPVKVLEKIKSGLILEFERIEKSLTD